MDAGAVTGPGDQGRAAEDLDADTVAAAASAALDRIRGLQEAMAAVRGSADSERGDVHVTAEGSGAMVELRLDPAALSRPADELGRVIVETAEAAARAAYERHLEVVADYSSDRSGSTYTTAHSVTGR